MTPPSRPPGRERESGPATKPPTRPPVAEPSPPPKPQASAVASVARGADAGRDEAPSRRAGLLALSDERDRWMARVLDAERAAYLLGYADGDHAGYERGARVCEADFRPVAERAAHPGPTFAELEARRWGPGGREHFADPRPGDYPGKQP